MRLVCVRSHDGEAFLKLLSTLFTLVALASNHNREPHTLQNNDDDGLIPFRMTYNYRDVTYTINGHEPAAAALTQSTFSRLVFT